ncbi:MAG: NADPH-dependent 7-cyano-7-deazaguanine reductase QueF [Paludibacter sp.]|nr:NADPH-dependent 7-cyano-7-deazaguanine reductase QueF [Paludibacter sp.]
MADFNLNESILGKVAGHPDKYDAGLLFRIPRSENRIRYNIQDSALPFCGTDTWNCYELSFLTDNGLPVCRVMKMIYDAGNKYLVESKSLKLYLNSFNMERMGKTIAGATQRMTTIIRKDLSDLLETDVQIVLFDGTEDELPAFPELQQKNLLDQIDTNALQSIPFEHFLETPDLLKFKADSELHTYEFRTDLLRSNCRVTNQPDWGDLFLKITCKAELDLLSVVAYLVSFRKENHFHEEVVEMIYKRFYDLLKPESLIVAAMYTRRGGIDINPVRSTKKELINDAFLSTKYRLEKTLRQ